MAAAETGEAPDPGRVLAGSIGFLLSKLGFHISSGFAEVLTPLDINPGHFGLLRILQAAEAQSQQALGDALEIPPSRMVAIIDDLEGRGLVERQRSSTDRRVNLLHLTPKGTRVMDKASVVATAWEEKVTRALSAAERETLIGLLAKLAADQGMPVGVHPGMARPAP